MSEHGETGLLLISAIFVDANAFMVNQFDRYRTRYGEKFFVDTNLQRSCDYMWMIKTLCYYEDERCQVVRQLYEGDVAMSLYCFLPRERHGLADFEKTLTPEYFLDLVNTCDMTTKLVEVSK